MSGCAYIDGECVSSGGDVPFEEEEEENCYYLSKIECKQAPGCSYSSNSRSCSPSEGYTGLEVEEEEAELEVLTPPSPDTAPPEGWNEMKRNKSGGPGMHNACACLLPLPNWFGSEGGFWCFCI
jgi:hypothetical protein